VVHPHRLARLQDIDVDAKLREAPLALEVAVEAERAGIPPAGLTGVDDEPAVAVIDTAELRLAE
jgi:hypothetical protein